MPRLVLLIETVYPPLTLKHIYTMGAQTSKVARKLPTKARPETLQNIPKESPSTIASAPNVASGNKRLKMTITLNINGSICL